MPIGLVPSGLVLQLSDLLLEEQPIGEGAEGKVSPGRGVRLVFAMPASPA